MWWHFKEEKIAFTINIIIPEHIDLSIVQTPTHGAAVPKKGLPLLCPFSLGDSQSEAFLEFLYRLTFRILMI